jgi:hypothetical protein
MQTVKVDGVPAVVRIISCHDGKIRHGVLHESVAPFLALKRTNELHPYCGYHSVETYRNIRSSKQVKTDA